MKQSIETNIHESEAEEHLSICNKTISQLWSIFKKKSRLSYDEVSSLSRTTSDYQFKYMSKTRIWDKEWIISETWKEILPCEYDDVDRSVNGRVILAKKNGKTGIRSKWGKVVEPCVYDEIIDYSERLHVIKGDKMGIWTFPKQEIWFNKCGNMVIPCEYDDIVRVSEEYRGYWKNSYYIVKKWGKSGIISLSGEIIAPCEYDEITDYFVKMIEVKKWDKTGIISTRGKILIPCKYDKIERYYLPVFDSYNLVYIWDKQWILSKSGKELLPCKYDDIERINNTTVSCTQWQKISIHKIF